MAKEKKDLTKPKYKATNPKKFAASFTPDAPCYDKLSNGESISLDLKNKHVQSWIQNKIIVKEK